MKQLFLKIYDKNRGLCSKLLNTFNEINEKGNTDRDNELSTYLDLINRIYSNAENIQYNYAVYNAIGAGNDLTRAKEYYKKVKDNID